MTHIALLIPALNEEHGMHLTARVARDAHNEGLVSSVYVLDGGSTDETVNIAKAHKVDVVDVTRCFTELGPVLGKGDSLFRGVHSIRADWYVFLDADLGNVNREHIAALVKPISTGKVRFVKGGFVRVDEHGQPREIPGGRVTEEFGRPLLRCVSSELADLSQPLSGQIAIEGKLARSLNFLTGYGIEIAMLIDIWRSEGSAAIIEADMGAVNNRWKPDADLGDVIDDVVSAAQLRGITGVFPHREATVVERKP